MESAKIQISIRLLEKLAGVKRTEPSQRRPQRGPHGPPALGRLPFPPADVAGGPFALDPDVRGALTASRRVGALLLKAEEAEEAAVRAAAEELISKEYSAPMRQPPCQAERDAVVSCYGQNKEGAWACSGLVEAYAACAAAASGHAV